MAKIFIVRTCETVANLNGRISNYTPLTPNGFRQAEKVRDRIKSFDIHFIYSSEFDSAFKTAETISQAFGLPVIKCPEFNQINIDMSNLLEFHQFNGAVTTFEYDGTKVKAHGINDISSSSIKILRLDNRQTMERQKLEC